MPKTDRKQPPPLNPIPVPTTSTVARACCVIPCLPSGGISKTLLKLRDVFMSEIHTFMDAQDLNKEEGPNPPFVRIYVCTRLAYRLCILCSCPVRRGGVRCRRRKGDRRNEEDASQTAVGQIQEATTHIRKEISLTAFHKCRPSIPYIHHTYTNQIVPLHFMPTENTAYAM